MKFCRLVLYFAAAVALPGQNTHAVSTAGPAAPALLPDPGDHEGDEGAHRRSRKMDRREQPTNYLLLQAYLGSVYTLDSRDAWPGPGKLTYLRNGGRQWLDAAVAAAPDNPAVRFVRAIDYYELPFFFGKGQTARDDFQILLKQIDGEIKTPYVLNTETSAGDLLLCGPQLQAALAISRRRRMPGTRLKLDPKSRSSAENPAIELMRSHEMNYQGKRWRTIWRNDDDAPVPSA
jgi:hypothetical protein